MRTLPRLPSAIRDGMLPAVQLHRSSTFRNENSQKKDVWRQRCVLWHFNRADYHTVHGTPYFHFTLTSPLSTMANSAAFPNGNNNA